MVKYTITLGREDVNFLMGSLLYWIPRERERSAEFDNEDTSVPDTLQEILDAITAQVREQEATP